MRIDWHGDDGYEEARQAAVWNLRKPARYPEVIVQADNENDVIDAVRLAREKNLKIKVRGTGHNRSASFLVDGGMLLNLGELRELSIDKRLPTKPLAASLPPPPK
jgi:FAD/FMN-containing dehydrogenase